MQERAKSSTIAINFKLSHQNQTNNNLKQFVSTSNKFANITNKLMLSKDNNGSKKPTTFHYATLRSNSTQNLIEPENKLILKLPKNLA